MDQLALLVAAPELGTELVLDVGTSTRSVPEREAVELEAGVTNEPVTALPVELNEELAAELLDDAIGVLDKISEFNVQELDKDEAGELSELEGKERVGVAELRTVDDGFIVETKSNELVTLDVAVGEEEKVAVLVCELD